MDEWRSGAAADGSDGQGETIVVRRHRVRRIATIAALSLVLLLLAFVAAVWVARRPIATGFLEREFERRGVQAEYQIDRVGLRTQQVSNLVIGDPEDPDLTARFAQIQLRFKWDGSVEVYRIVARGVRLEGRIVDGRVSWGQIDKLMPPPSDKPFALPNFVLDVADASISLATPFGPLGFALQGSGNLSGGFKGRLATSSPRIVFGRCQVTGVESNVAIAVAARRPHVDGPMAAERFVCPQSRFQMMAPRFDIDSRFNESFTSFDGEGRMAVRTLVAGANGLANFIGDVTFQGTPTTAFGEVDLAAQQSRMGPVFAERTRVRGKYRLGASTGTFTMAGEYAAEDSTLDPAMLSTVTNALEGLRQTPVGPVAAAMGDAIARTVRDFDADGTIRVVNFPGGGAARVDTANVRASSGARVTISGGDGFNYYWPSARVRVDGLIQMQGGGLPTGRALIRQPRSGAPMSGVAQFAPYSAGGARLALAPIRFAAGRDGSTQVSTVAELDGPIPDGRITRLRVPISGRLSPDGGLAVGTSCIVVSFAEVRSGALRVGPTRLPVCPVGGAIFSRTAGGALDIGARVNRPVLNGVLGGNPFLAQASGIRMEGERFTADALRMRLGRPSSPIIFNADRLYGSYAGGALGGTFTGAESTIRDVPIRLSEMSGSWMVDKGDLSATGMATVTDRNPEPRFYPLVTRDLNFLLADGSITAGGTLRHPGTGTRVTDVSIDHDLESGNGQAILDVPGITFGPGLQPEELTRLTEGVVALVEGTVTGQGRINWSGGGAVTSTGQFSTANMDLAAPFGPVEGLTTTVRFTDLLNMETAPGQIANVRSINPGILVENGVIRYQLLPNSLVKIERGEWPFMGGRLVLEETILNFGRPSAKRLTFRVIGFDAKMFIDSLGFEGLEITGTFDGVLPMIFDESGGRIVGGRLDARPPGGVFRYTGTKPDAGLVAGAAFDLLSNIRYQSMIIRLEGDLAGEFATRFTIADISLGTEGGFVAGLIRRAFRNVPLIVNLNIEGPFRALIQMAKGFRDPTGVIEPVMPFPLDAPGIVTETRTLGKEEDQTRTTPLDEVKTTPEPTQPSE